MAIAQRLQENKRQEGTLARVGGDEFILLLPHIANKNDGVKSVTRILEAMEAPFDIDACAAITPAVPSGGNRRHILFRLA